MLRDKLRVFVSRISPPLASKLAGDAGGREIKMVNTVNSTPASTLEKCKALLQEVVTELTSNSNASNF